MEFKIITELPTNITTKDIDIAVNNFVNESHCEDNKIGLMNQTLETIAQAIVFKQPSSFFWLSSDGNGVVAYALTHISKDVDNSLCYYMTQAWIRKDYRRTKFVKECFEKLRNHAKNLMCRHIIVVSSRNTDAYLRFLGKKWHVYTTLLKEDI